MILLTIVIIISIWIAASIIVDARNQRIRMTSFYRVSNKYPDKNLRGQIVKIRDVYKSEIALRTTEQIAVKREYQSQKMLPNGTSKAIIATRTEFEYGHLTIKSNQFEKALKRVKDINKPEGGEGTMKKMPRLWKWIIIYAPLAVLVWDVTLHLNMIGGWIASFALVQK